ncbi:MAG: DUF3794 domain-containing protein [Eubacterium sp.]|nr:DUF3794 domain-containing protein [Eubacterium sp.]
MEYEKNYSCIEKNEKVFSKNIDIEQDFSESIPAYCDDIYRIVKCLSHSFITSVSVSSNEILIFGKTEIMLTYYNESSCLCYADFDEEFSRNINVENLSDYAFACADICDKYTNFRVINQRRIDVHSSAVINLNVYDRIKYPCLLDCNGAKLNKQGIKSSDIIAFNISKIEFDEEFSLPSTSSELKRIISSNCSAYLTETKIIKDKALIKADIDFEILYTVGDEDEIQSVRNTVSVSKIIDQSSIDDGDISISNVTVGDVFQKAKAVSGDNLDTIEVFGEIEVSTLFIRENENAYITDGYIPKRKCECSYSDYKLITNGRELKDNSVFNVATDFSSDIKEIKEVSVNLSTVNMRNSKLVSKVDISIIYENESDSLASMNSTSEIEYDLKGAENAFAAFNLKSLDYALPSSKRVEIRLNVDINGYAFDERNIKILSDIESDDEEIDSPSITIYFAKQSDTVWDIAKSFSSDEEMIKKENNLQNSVIDKDRILIIPRV